MIHPQAIVDPTARLADDVEVGPWTIIGPDVEIGEGTVVGPHVVIAERTKIGKNNKIFSFSSIGDAPQHLNEQGGNTWLEMGDNNIVREYCTLNRGALGEGVTLIGNHNFFMAYVHIAHDCIIDNHTVFVNNATVAGHVHVKDYAYLGGFSGVHQYCTIGSYSFVSGAAMITKDVLPYIIVYGNPAIAYGLNKVGLKRRGFRLETLRTLNQAYKLIFNNNHTTKEALPPLKALAEECDAVQPLIEALEQTTRGVVRNKKQA